MIRCTRCRRILQSPAVISGSMTLGPTCARIVGVTTGKRVAAPVAQAGQLPLFEVASPAPLPMEMLA